MGDARHRCTREDSGFSEDKVVSQEHAGKEGTRSLEEHAIDQLLDIALTEKDLDSSVLEAQRLPGFASKLRRKQVILAKGGELPLSNTTVRYLTMAFDGEVALDISPFSGLAAEHIVQAASKIVESER